MVLIDGKKVSAEIRNRLTKETAELKSKTGRMPGLATVLVGEDPASAVYVRNKNKICQWSRVASCNQQRKLYRNHYQNRFDGPSS